MGQFGRSADGFPMADSLSGLIAPRRLLAESFRQTAEPLRQLAEHSAKPSSRSASWRNHSAKPLFLPKTPHLGSFKQLKYRIL